MLAFTLGDGWERVCIREFERARVSWSFYTTLKEFVISYR